MNCAVSECLAQPLPRHRELLRKYSRLAHHGHEVGIPDPAWQSVQMKMSGYACTRSSAEVQPHIESVGAVHATQCFFRSLRQIHQLMRDHRVERCQRSLMLIWHHHDVAGVVRVAVETNECLL